jgi:acetoacetate decarboxylase
MNDIIPGAGMQTNPLTKGEGLAGAYAMPFASPAYAAGPDEFFDRPALPSCASLRVSGLEAPCPMRAF